MIIKGDTYFQNINWVYIYIYKYIIFAKLSIRVIFKKMIDVDLIHII
jgi:hypothetical protein